MDCREKILSNNYYDVIIGYPVNETAGENYDFCYANIENLYNVIYVNRRGIPNIEEYFFEYQTIPKLYGLMQQGLSREGFDPGSLISSGITQVQREPLNLTGQGVVICVIDTGERVIIMSS